MFKKIKNIEDIAPFVKDKKEITFSKHLNGVVIGCYNYMDSKTFSSIEALECRGIAFDREGKIISRPLHKFFNIGEKDYLTQSEIKKRKIVGVLDKIDGSMIATAWLDGNLLLRSKKSFTSDVAKMADDFIRQKENKNILDFATKVASNNLTAIFEFTHPQARIVVEATTPALRLLHIRDNYTGEYVMLDKDHQVHQWIKDFDIPVVERFDMDIDQAIQSLEDLTNREGYVFQMDNGDMVKAKCPWYLRLHRSITFLRERDIAVLALNEDLDDVKNALREAGIDLTLVEEVESRVKDNLLAIDEEIESIYREDKDMERKDFAQKHSSNPLFGLIMSKFSGKEVMVKEWYAKKRLKQDFSLRVLADSTLAEELSLPQESNDNNKSVKMTFK